METEQQKTPEQIQHESNKAIRHALATAHYLLNYQCKYMVEQFGEVQHSISVLDALCKDLQAKIEAFEPPVEKEEPKAKAPYVVDVPNNG